jgi:diguanylate cyclase (GGDEF)-like protein
MNRRYRFMTVLATILIVGFLFTSIISYFVARKSLSEQIAGSTLPLTSDNIYSEIQKDLLRPIFISSLMAHDTFVRDWVLAGEPEPDKMVRFLDEIQRRFGTMTSFFVSDISHKYYHSSGVLKTVDKDDPQDDWYFAMPKIVQNYQVNIDLDTADMNSMAVFINHKVYDYSGLYIGTIGVGLGVKSVKDLLETYRQRYGRTIFFVDRQGAVTLVGKEFDEPENIRDIPGLKAYATQILTSPSTALTYKQNGQIVYFNSRLVEDFNWYLIVLQNETVGESRIQTTMLINIAISLVITLIVLAIAGVTLGNDQKKLEAMATTDKLTGLVNRQLFDILFNQAISSCRRHKTPLALLLIDIDYFKAVNDSYGHQVGDQVLQAVAKELDASLRNGDDKLFRWGGEEFLVLSTDCNPEQTAQLAERIRTRVESLAVYHDKATIKVSVSIGTAQYTEDDTSALLIARADRALYRAKSQGRNRVVIAED